MGEKPEETYTGPDEPVSIDWTRAKVVLLRAAIARAEKAGADTFQLDGHDFYVPYARYLEEYLAPRVGLGKWDRKG